MFVCHSAERVSQSGENKISEWCISISLGFSVQPCREIRGFVVTYMEVIIRIVVLYNVIEHSWRGIISWGLNIAFMARLALHCTGAIWHTCLSTVRDKRHNLMQNVYIWEIRGVSGDQSAVEACHVIGVKRSTVRNLRRNMKQPRLLTRKHMEMPFVHLKDGVLVSCTAGLHLFHLLTNLLTNFN